MPRPLHMSKKRKANPGASAVAPVQKGPVDTTEIDNLFSVFSSKQATTTAKVEKPQQQQHLPQKETEQKSENPKDSSAKNGNLEAEAEEGDFDSEDDAKDLFEEEEEEPTTGSDETDATLKKGTPYDPSRDDFTLPGANNVNDSDDDFFDSRGRKRKTRSLTEDGLPIYTPNELRIGLGGGTDLCPFDCNCCY